MPEMTERQAAAWQEAVAELQRFSSSIPDELGRWDVIWQDETRPGRGQALDARFNDGEHFAQITMDVYGFPRTSIAELEWIHASEDEECPCGHADEEPEPVAEAWEYGFYDSQTGPTAIWWSCFGLPFKSAEMARHTGEKNVYGEAVIVRRLPGMEAWERVPESDGSGS